MHTLNRRQAGSALAVTLGGLAWPLAGMAQTAASLPVSAFFQDPLLGGAVLSPSGTAVALQVRSSPEARATLAVLDLTTMKVQPVAGFNDASVGYVRWLNDQRLIFGADTDSRWSSQRTGGGIYAVNRDGSNYRVIVGWDEWVRSTDVGRVHLPAGAALLLQQGAQRDDSIYVMEPDGSTRGGVRAWRLLRVSTDSAEIQRVPSPPDAQGWVLDRQGLPLTTVTARDRRASLHLRDPASGAWRKLRDFDRYLGDDIRPLHVGPDGTLYVAARQGSDTLALHTLDLRSGELSKQPLLAVPGFDIEAQFVSTDDKLLGVRVQADAEITQWWDEDMKALQATVDELLPVTANRLTPPRRGNGPWLLLTSWSDVQPPRHYLFHRGTKKLTLLGAAQPGIAAAQMAQVDFVRFKARDGLEIPAYLTRPTGSAGRPLPLVVMVHGGPWVRGGYWGWEAEAQFLASRGYAVLAPEFRGSTGFGHRHFTAGLKQWGQAMQDDLADAARWAVAQGIADRQRIAVAGASYGGYAALMGLVRDGDLFRCAISLVGVSDITLLYDEALGNVDDDWRLFGLKTLVGDPRTEAERLKAASPVQQAERIRNPVLLAYGRQDRRVPLVHGERIRDALKRHNAQVEYVVYDDEGHGLAKPVNRIDFWTRAEAFLGRHLAPPK